MVIKVYTFAWEFLMIENTRVTCVYLIVKLKAIKISIEIDTG